jgi:hypothetical protein
MATPLSVDQYSRFMAEVFDEKAATISNTTVFQSFFGRSEHGSRTVFSPDALVVDIDIIRGNERMAALIQRGADTLNIGDKGKTAVTGEFTNFTRVYPLSEEKSSIGATELLNRTAGENPYEGKTKYDRLRAKAREYHLEHMRRFVRLFEYLSGQSLLTGKMPGLIGTTNTKLVYDFRRNADNFVTVTTPWDQTGATPITDIDAACRIARVNGKVLPNFILLSGDVMSAFLQNTQVQTFTNKLYFSLVAVSPSNPVPPQLQPIVDGGAACRGLMVTPEGHQLWIFTYIGIYTDSSGDPQNFMPDGTALLGYYGARCDRYFGPSEVLPSDNAMIAWYQEYFGFNMQSPPTPMNIKNMGAVITPAMFYNDAFKDEGNKTVTIRTQTAPIFATTQTDAFVTLSGLIEVSS